MPEGACKRYPVKLLFGTPLPGLDVDIVAPSADLAAYWMVAVPTLPIISQDFAEKLTALDNPVLLAPHSGSKTGGFCTPKPSLRAFSYQRAKKQTHHTPEMLKRRTGLTNAR